MQRLAPSPIPSVLALSLAVLAVPAHANDTVANFAAGGLVFGKTDAVEMRSEDLFVSEEQIAVTYEFVNRARADVTTTVAFPMPEIRVEPFGPDVSIPSDDLDNPFGFETTVDGKPVDMRLEQIARVGGADVTATLKRLGLPLAPQAETARAVLDRLRGKDKADAIAKGIAIEETYDEGGGMESHLAPNWSLATTYHWDQTFPAGKSFEIAHTYIPSVGQSIGTSLGTSYADPAETARQRRLYCIEDDLMRSIEKRTKSAGEGGIAFGEKRIDYILATGANWAKPIADFRLVVDKGEAKNLVSFCANGVRKIAPTRFEVRYKDFKPKDDLHVLILVPGN